MSCGIIWDKGFTILKTKHQKRTERRKNYERRRNASQYKQGVKFVLRVRDNGEWKSVMGFYSMKQVDAHLATVEDLRRRNAGEIVEGMIVEVKTGKVICRIAPHRLTDPAFIGSKALA